jgi:hypothetical protein
MSLRSWCGEDSSAAIEWDANFHSESYKFVAIWVKVAVYRAYAQ